MIKEVEEIFDWIGEFEDVWVLFCFEIEINRRLCLEYKI